eukprot:scaffold401_cov399-Prasinococcus_capsulatus_cf.AAC.45
MQQQPCRTTFTTCHQKVSSAPCGNRCCLSAGDCAAQAYKDRICCQTGQAHHCEEVHTKTEGGERAIRLVGPWMVESPVAPKVVTEDSSYTAVLCLTTLLLLLL